MSTFDPLDLHGQERAREDRARKLALDIENEAEDLKWLMAGRRGRRIVFRLLELSPPTQDPFTGNANVTAYELGNQRLGRRLQSLILAKFPELYVQMVKEHDNGNDNGGASPKSN